VDGGLMNNKPLELARRRLAGERRRNPRAGAQVDRAVLMIDPFPGERDPASEVEPPQGFSGSCRSCSARSGTRPASSRTSWRWPGGRRTISVF